MILFFVEGCGDHRYLHVLTHSCPTRRSSVLLEENVPADAGTDRLAKVSGRIQGSVQGPLPRPVGIDLGYRFTDSTARARQNSVSIREKLLQHIAHQERKRRRPRLDAA